MKFDQDEDGFLWPEEVLEALENVNTDLLKDSHLRYVFRVSICINYLLYNKDKITNTFYLIYFFPSLSP